MNSTTIRLYALLLTLLLLAGCATVERGPASPTCRIEATALKPARDTGVAGMEEPAVFHVTVATDRPATFRDFTLPVDSSERASAFARGQFFQMNIKLSNPGRHFLGAVLVDNDSRQLFSCETPIDVQRKD